MVKWIRLAAVGPAFVVLGACPSPGPSSDPNAQSVEVTLSGDGTGRVTSDPPGINCENSPITASDDCQQLFDPVTIKLFATPLGNSRFVVWSGEGCSGTDPEVSFNNDRSRACDARFERVARFHLTVSRTGSGAGTVTSAPAGITCGGDCEEEYLGGAVVTLLAEPDGVSGFIEWTGSPGCAGQNASIDVVVDQDKTCVARFELLPVLTVTTSGTGSGIVTSDPPGIMAPPADMQPYPFLQLVTLTAAMDANTVLGGWTGDCTPTANPLVATVLMGTAADVARDRTCDARFDPKPPAGPFQFLDDFSLPFRSDAFDRSRTGTTVFVSDIGLGSATHEISFANATNIVSAGSGSLCPGVTAVVDAQDPVVGRLLLGYSSTSTLSCATLYPLGQAVQFFNVGTTTGKAIPFPGDSQAQLIALFGSSAVRRQSPTGTTDIPTSPVTERSCPRFLATTPTYLYVVLVEGTPGTSTEQCSGNRGLKRIRLSDNAVVGSAVFGTTPRNPVLTPDGLIIYVPDYAENVVHVVTTSGLAVTRSIPVPGGPTAVALTDDAAYLIVTLWDLDQVAMVDLADDQIVGTIDSRGRHPTAVFTAPNGVGVVLNFGDGATNTPASIATFRYVP